MKRSMILRILVLFVLGASPTFAINKCTFPWGVGFQQSGCPEIAVKSEVYVDKVGAPLRTPVPRYVDRSGDRDKQSVVPRKSQISFKSDK